MPEGPEARKMARCLADRLSGKTLISFEINSKSRYYSRELANRDLLTTGSVLHTVRSHGKKVIFVFDDFLMVTSLGMEGSWQFTKGDNSGILVKFGRVSEGVPRIAFTEEKLYFDDSRHFGTLTICKLEDEASALKDVGLDLYHRRIPLEEYKEIALKAARMEVHLFLVDQKRIAGIGNIYRAEILYRAGVAPMRRVSSLSDEEIEKLHRFSIEVLDEAYSMGTTITGPDGSEAGFITQVYGRTTDPKGNTVLKTRDKKDRTIHWVPAVQI